MRKTDVYKYNQNKFNIGLKEQLGKEKHEFFFVNPFYDLDNVISNEPANVISSKYKTRITD